MQRKTVTIRFEGLPSENGNVRLGDFVGRLSSFSAAIIRADRLVSGSHNPTFYFRIVDLRHKSPATITIEAYAKDTNIDFRGRSFHEVFSIMQQVKENRLQKPTDYDLLESIRKFVAPVGVSLGSLELISDEYDIQVTKEFKARMELEMAPENTHVGFIRGALEYINIHGGQKVFKIYPEIGPSRVTCYFPDELKEAAIDALGQFVEIHGIIHYKSVSTFPHQIDVKKLEVLPDEEELPSIFDLKGIALGLTGSLSSEEFAQGLKDAE
jgi:hypothetical protein